MCDVGRCLSKSGVHGIVELRLSTAAVSGPAAADPFILDTGSQFNGSSCAILKKLQLKFLTSILCDQLISQ